MLLLKNYLQKLTFHIKLLLKFGEFKMKSIKDEYVSYLRKILCLIMLTISSYEDIKTREVDDKIWIFFIPIGIIITLFEFFLKFIDFSYLILYFISILIAIIVSIIIYYSKFVGGADSKALITLSFLDPINLNKNIIHPFQLLY
jgi:preflagellin peptidase FlaK